MKKIFKYLLIFICLLFISSCSFLEKVCPHMYSHSYEHDNENHYKTCQICHHKEITKHEFDEGIIIDDHKDSDYGNKKISCNICTFYYLEKIDLPPHVHTYEFLLSFDDTHHWYNLTCGCDDIDKIPHNFNQVVESEYYKTNLPTTCERGTTYYYSCECGKKGTNTFEKDDKLEHSFTDFISNNDATCERNGTKTARCENGCDAHITEEDLGTKKDHDYEITYSWTNDNSQVCGRATCKNGCNSIIEEIVETEYRIINEATSDEVGHAEFISLEFENEIFSIQTKEITLHKIHSSIDGNSLYGYEYFKEMDNGSNLIKLYEDMYEVCYHFLSNNQDVEPSYGANNIYALETFNYLDYNLSLEEAKSVWVIFYIENPLFYWLSNDCLYTNDGKLILSIDQEYSSYEYRHQCDEAILQMTEECYQYVDEATNDLELALLIHDFIVNRIDYAYVDNTQIPSSEIWAHNLVGTAMKGEGVCESYAKTYLYLCLLNDIECIIVTGTSFNQGHAWNMIKINDEWYVVDATWNDQKTGVIYTYFGVGSNNLEDHTQNLPYMSTDNDVIFLYELPELSPDDLNIDMLKA